MTAAAAAAEERADAYQETLAERMARGPLPIAEALRYAIQIATCLRDLHMQGLVYGAVSSQLILVGPSGACLRTSGGLAQLGDGRDDVAAFAGVLREMLRRVERADELHDEIAALAVDCQEATPDIQYVLIALRVLGLRVRQSAVAARGPVLVRRAEMVVKKRARVFSWKPLVNLAASALWGK